MLCRPLTAELLAKQHLDSATEPLPSTWRDVDSALALLDSARPAYPIQKLPITNTELVWLHIVQQHQQQQQQMTLQLPQRRHLGYMGFQLLMQLHDTKKRLTPLQSSRLQHLLPQHQIAADGDSSLCSGLVLAPELPLCSA